MSLFFGFDHINYIQMNLCEILFVIIWNGTVQKQRIKQIVCLIAFSVSSILQNQLRSPMFRLTNISFFKGFNDMLQDTFTTVNQYSLSMYFKDFLL